MRKRIEKYFISLHLTVPVIINPLSFILFLLSAHSCKYILIFIYNLYIENRYSKILYMYLLIQYSKKNIQHITIYHVYRITHNISY